MKNKTENNRTYKMASGMVVKSKNAKNSFAGNDETKPEILHETRRGSFWLELFDPKTNQAIAKQVDPLDAEEWKVKNEVEK